MGGSVSGGLCIGHGAWIRRRSRLDRRGRRRGVGARRRDRHRCAPPRSGLPIVTTRRRLALRPQWAVSIAGALAVIGFVGYAQWNGSPERVQFATSVQQVLADQVTKLEAEQGDLRAQIAASEAKVLDFQNASTTSSSALSEVNKRLEDARLAV